jgi:dipeptidyl aminopeptidase/acylaminoacyl peptidase
MRLFWLARAAARFDLPWLLLACAACTPDLISLGSGRGDAAVEPPEQAFSAPTLLANVGLDGGKDDDPSLSADLTLLFFNSRREGGTGKEDIWFSTRSDAASAWSSPRPVGTLNTEERETGLALAPDGLTLWFSSDRSGGAGGLDVYVAARSDRSASWSAAERVLELSSEDDDLISSVADEGRTAYLARRHGDDDYDLFVAERDSTARPFRAPQPISALNSDEAESDAFSFAQGTRLVLTRDEDLWFASRVSTRAAFQLGQPLSSLNSDKDDRDPWLSQDGRYIVFSSDRDGQYALFEARR